MIKIEFTIDEYKKLPKDFQIDLILICNEILGIETNLLKIDGKEIDNRDDFGVWLLDNQITYPNNRK